MKKQKIMTTIAAVAAACCFALTGCADGSARGISSIEKTATDGTVDTYTVYYTDGTTTTFSVANGTNGSDGQDVTVDALYERYKQEYGEISYAEFLSLYLSYGGDDYSVVNKCLRSSAKVYSEFKQTVISGFRPGGITTTTQTALSAGSAVVYRVDTDYTYFITNYHVVYNANATTGISQNIHCYMYGSEGAPTAVSSNEYDYGDYGIACEFVGGSAAYDLAVLRAETSELLAVSDSVCAVEFADDYHVGQTAIAIGNPDDAGISVTKGVVSVDNDYITLNIDGTTREYRSIRIDTALYSGNSGGGLFNVRGELIGITNAGNGDEENINYAIPLSIVEGAVENIMYHYGDGKEDTNGVYKLTVGITVSSEKSKYVYDELAGYGEIVEDIVVASVESGSIAEKMGLQVGDKLRFIENGGTRYALNRYFDIADGLLRLTEGTEFSFVYERDGERTTTAVYAVQAADMQAVA